MKKPEELVEERRLYSLFLDDLCDDNPLLITVLEDFIEKVQDCAYKEGFQEGCETAADDIASKL